MNSANLMKSFEEVSENIPRKEWYYFHRNTIRNFIEYFPSLDHQTSAKVYPCLNNCLADIRENFQPTTDYSYYLMETYLRYLFPIYRSNFHFSVAPSGKALIFFCLIFIIISFILVNNLWYEISFILISAMISLKSIISIKRHRAYGFRY